LFVTFEGVEGAGKSTQVRLLRESLSRSGIAHVFTREPGGTPLGERMRELLIDPAQTMTAEAEVLLFNACRAELVDKIIAPALLERKLVVSDRFWDATLAYQGYGRGLPLSTLLTVSMFAARRLTPDITVLLDIPQTVSQSRLGGRAPDRLEAEDSRFHERVAHGYRDLAAKDPDRFVVLDGSRPPEELAAVILEAVKGRWHA